MPNETEIKDILVTFFRDATKGDYLEALNKAVSEISGLSPIVASADYINPRMKTDRTTAKDTTRHNAAFSGILCYILFV